MRDIRSQVRTAARANLPFQRNANTIHATTSRTASDQQIVDIVRSRTGVVPSVVAEFLGPDAGGGEQVPDVLKKRTAQVVLIRPACRGEDTGMPALIPGREPASGSRR